jgi:hypothetical protein
LGVQRARDSVSSNSGKRSGALGEIVFMRPKGNTQQFAQQYPGDWAMDCA